ncbi:ATP-binding protein [Inmirania thermothiophila]|uniref:tRNA 2-thiocytidine biosynthesis protein TtcA n=1 Tax=Inmirania thermothiophila TaxID=1750597 RepID=A0A3N1Y9F3_9GAMM|nr:ATP-binding protein [Inmirania thermothiophila]ROR34242.1 tRNA 2-thiocytidine biosynthesis protein TtcA [Inmirania thermothiophila]
MDAVTPPKSILRLAGRAIGDYDMIRDGDRILVAVSGGKDSLTLLHVLLALRRRAPVRFGLGVFTFDPEIEGFEPAPLRDYVAALGLPMHYHAEPMIQRARDHMEEGGSFCAFCSRIKRGVMYRIARSHGYNVLALGQHLDDLAESFLMSAFDKGRLETMKAHYLNDAGDVRVIRPLVYVRERQTAAFAEAAGLPVVPDSCPACFRMPTRRAHMKALLAAEEKAQPRLFRSLLSAMRPLMGAPPRAEAGLRRSA